MAIRSTTARRLATVIVATAAVSAVGATAASADTTPTTTTATTTTTTTQTPEVAVPPLSVPQVGLLLNNLLGTVDGLLGTQLGTPTTTTQANEDKPLLEKTVANLTGTTKELPLLGGVVGALTDDLGLSEPAATPASHPRKPATATPSKPTATTVKGGKHHRVDSVAPGSTWTAPMVEAPQVAPAPAEEHRGSPVKIPHLLREVGSLLPSHAAEAAAAGAGAATVALIVLGGIAVTGAAGAASAAGRRGLINGSAGGVSVIKRNRAGVLVKRDDADEHDLFADHEIPDFAVDPAGPADAAAGARQPRSRRAWTKLQFALAALSATPVLFIGGLHAWPWSDTPAAAGNSGAVAPGHENDPVSVSLSRLGITAPLDALTTDPGTGVPQVPGLGRAGWISGGVKPGDLGRAVILGRRTQSGGDVFARLGQARAGDKIVVTTASGRTLTFVVRSVEQFAARELPAARIEGGGKKQAQLRLITSAGTYDQAKGGFPRNVVVFADLAG